MRNTSSVFGKLDNRGLALNTRLGTLQDTLVGLDGDWVTVIIAA